MQVVLSRHKPKDISREEFNQLWENAGYTLQPLYKTIQESRSSKESIKENDFDCPNHYAKLAYRAGFIEALDYVCSLLPNSAKEK